MFLSLFCLDINVINYCLTVTLQALKASKGTQFLFLRTCACRARFSYHFTFTSGFLTTWRDRAYNCAKRLYYNQVFFYKILPIVKNQIISIHTLIIVHFPYPRKEHCRLSYLFQQFLVWILYHIILYESHRLQRFNFVESTLWEKLSRIKERLMPNISRLSLLCIFLVNRWQNTSKNCNLIDRHAFLPTWVGIHNKMICSSFVTISKHDDNSLEKHIAQ